MNKIEDLAINVARNPELRSLISLLPLGSAIDIQIQTIIENYKKERLRHFFDELSNGTIELTEEVIKSEPFLHNYFATIEAVKRTLSREKITLFAKLFKSYTVNMSDQYETYLDILNTLTVEEIKILKIYNDLELTTIPRDGFIQSRLDANKKIWKEFKEEVKKQFNIDSIDEYLVRIERTGCIYIPRLTSNDLRPYAAMTTSIFRKFREYIFVNDLKSNQDTASK